MWIKHACPSNDNKLWENKILLVILSSSQSKPNIIKDSLT